MVFLNEEDKKNAKLGACLRCPKNNLVVKVSPRTAVIIQKSGNIDFASFRVKCSACGEQFVNPVVTADSYETCYRYGRYVRKKSRKN